MAETNESASCSHEPDPDDMSLFFHHLLSSSSSSSSSASSINPIFVEKGKAIPFSKPKPPTQASDVALALAARRAVGLGGTQSGWDVFCHVKTLSVDDPTRQNSTAEVREAGPVLLDTRNLASSGSGDWDAAGPGKRRKAPSSAPDAGDFDEFDCESEEGGEASEEPSSKQGPTKSASKRSRAAEVHNLSEKRRRSRINEKMKALQNLIPNSNKTDKASMLDEAIEYLKQLQLQVQMLSMRNGLNLQPMYLPGSLQPLQVPQMSMGIGAGNDSLLMNMGIGMLPMKQDSTTQTFGLSIPSIPSNQPTVIPNLTNISNSETLFRSDLSQGHHRSYQFPAASRETYKEDVIAQQQLDIDRSMKYPPGGPSN